ncbi:restriction endonuclease [Citrobacter sp. Cy230]|uniref:restriction endonuclease n=1 Tax=Citrobacter sp. Cy230 TaxID=2985163 RepID=UPI002575AA8F|nr:restriction endonuclease [Citrobacter sp. Cy230]MDM2724199.1 restriction endonuclease [Citrobacter sp. Cy230]
MSIFNQLTPDEWEVFASYYLQEEGYIILEEPSIGADGGKDIIVKDDTYTYLVSCKHYSRSRKNVRIEDENSILDRMVQHGTDGFVAFYSTKASNGLDSYIKKHIPNYRLICGDEIFKNLPNIPLGVKQSFFDSGNITTKNVSEYNYRRLECSCGCKKDLLDSDEIFDSYICVYVNYDREIDIVSYSNNHFAIDFNDCILTMKTSRFLYIESLCELEGEIKSRLAKFLNSGFELSSGYYKKKTQIIESLLQVLYPSNWKSN